MKLNKSTIGRLSAEFTVIVFGVLLALAVDRWFEDLDSRQSEARYLVQLTTNLVADSARLAGTVAVAQAKVDWAPVAMAALQGELQPEQDYGQFLRRLDRYPAWTPFQSNRSTWEDLIATGNLEVIQDIELRETLGTYYSRTEQFAVQDADMDQQLTVIEMAFWQLLEPERRLAIIQRTAGDIERGEVEAAVERLRSNREMYSEFVQAQFMWSVIGAVYEGHLEAVERLLAQLRASAL